MRRRDDRRDHDPGGLASLDAALDEIAGHSPAPVAIGVTGKPFVFAVGADLSGVPSITSAADAREIAETGHRVFRRRKDAGVPTFAFVNGAAMGGGWPFWLGGISAYLDRAGVSEAVTGAHFQPRGAASLPA